MNGKGAVNRRHFLKGTLGAMAAPMIVSSSVLGGSGTPPSERVNIAHIGVGNRGYSLMRGFLGQRDGQIVAVCDPFKTRREERAKQVAAHYADREGMGDYKGCTLYRDFREVLARDDVDAVVIATPDHWHVPIAIAAARAGKDMYVEKPLSVAIEWNKRCREICQRYGVVFQYGTQQRSMAHCRHGCELVRNGRVGEVHTIKVTAPNGVGQMTQVDWGSTEPIDPPETFDYDLWLGPAPVSPYTRDRCTSFGSYHVYDNSIGFLGGWGAHPLDIAVWGCDPDYTVPVELEGTGDIPTEGLFDTVINWKLEGRYGNGVKFEFTTGGDSTTFMGPDGWIKISRGGNDAEPKSLLDSEIGPEELHLKESHSHGGHFLDCVKSRARTVSPVDVAVESDTISLLSDIAVRTGRKIRWDTEKEQIIDDPQASRMMNRGLRSPWHL